MIETTAGLEPFEVADLDADTLLWLLGDSEAQDRAAVRRKLRYALHWCVLHPGTVEDYATWGDGESGAARECDLHIGGEGTPLVAAGAAEEFAAALGITTGSGLCWLADALDLAHRLRRTWDRLQGLEIPGWKARRLASLTRSLPPVAAAWVDEQLADRLDRVGLPTMERVVAEAVAVFCPELLADRERRGRAAWRVTLHHDAGEGDGQWAGSSYLDAHADTRDLIAFHDLVCEVAERLRGVGDTDTLDQRKAKALGLIGRGEHDDDTALTSTARTTCGDTGGGEPGGGEPGDANGDSNGGGAPRSTLGPERRRPGQPTKLYLHVTDADLAAHGAGGPAGARPGTGVVERLGPATLDLIARWLRHQRFTLTPVLDLGRCDAVDEHDPPPWMREQVVLRDRHCIFPWCHTDARSCDLDHIEPYDTDGPPAQTNPENLAPLCRRHHRAKTFWRWRYHRLSDGSYAWTSPRGQRFLVHPTSGTTRLRDGPEPR